MTRLTGLTAGGTMATPLGRGSRRPFVVLQARLHSPSSSAPAYGLRDLSPESATKAGAF